MCFLQKSFLQKLFLQQLFCNKIFVSKVGSSVGSDAEWAGSHSEEGTASRSNPG